jgi:hypothetical protein
MKIEVNSKERAEKIQRIIAERLGGQAVYKITSITSPEAMLKDRPAPGTTKEHEELMQLPEVQAKLAEMMRDHWRGWVNIPLPALNGKTPMEAVRNPDGKEQVQALLQQFERDMESHGQAGIAREDLDLLRERLGLAGAGDDM